MSWYDVFKVFVRANRDPLKNINVQNADASGVGVVGDYQLPDIRNYNMGSSSPLRIDYGGNADFIDLSSPTSRISRYKEYDRLQIISEIETALNTFADEACLSGDTRVATPFGFFTLKELAETKNKDEKFLVYCWDFQKGDYTLGWAYHPRKVKTAQTVRIALDNGVSHYATPDHLFLLLNGNWKMAGDLKFGDELMPFYRLRHNPDIVSSKVKQFPRIFTFHDGWKSERTFIDYWKSGKSETLTKARFIEIARLFQSNAKNEEIFAVFRDKGNTKECIFKEGFNISELRYLASKQRYRRVIGVSSYKEMDVYDLSVEGHKNFATDSVIVHNCQEDHDGKIFKLKCKNDYVKKELDALLYHGLDINSQVWSWAKNLYKYGDGFLEVVIDITNPKKGILKIQSLPADSMFRIETIRGRLIEFQQSKEGPDYNSLQRVDVLQASKAELDQATALRFTPEQIIHMRIGDDRKTFYPYGVSMLESARIPAHNLVLMEDSMMVYRISRSSERRVFYIDVAQLPPFKVESFMERLKDQLRKKKVFNKRTNQTGASGVDERMQPPPIDDDIWVPLQRDSRTRIETLQGGNTLGIIADVDYFRNKLYVALQFPRNYLSNNDPSATRLTLSQQDVRFARMIERLQKPLVYAVREICIRHLKFRGYPESDFYDLDVKITPPSDWRTINRQEAEQPMFDRSAMLKGSQLMSDYDIMHKILSYTEEEAKELVARNKAQKIEDVKLQIMGQSPELLGIPMPENEQGTQVGATNQGPNPELSPEEGGEQQSPQQEEQPKEQKKPKAILPEPTTEEIKKYNLEITNDESETEQEEVDEGEIEGSRNLKFDKVYSYSKKLYFLSIILYIKTIFKFKR